MFWMQKKVRKTSENNTSKYQNIIMFPHFVFLPSFGSSKFYFYCVADRSIHIVSNRQKKEDLDTEVLDKPNHLEAISILRHTGKMIRGGGASGG